MAAARRSRFGQTAAPAAIRSTEKLGTSDTILREFLGAPTIGINPHRLDSNRDFVLQAVLVKSLGDDQLLRAVVLTLERARDIKGAKWLQLAFSVVWLDAKVLDRVRGVAPFLRMDHGIGHFRQSQHTREFPEGLGRGMDRMAPDCHLLEC